MKNLKFLIVIVFLLSFVWAWREVGRIEEKISGQEEKFCQAAKEIVANIDSGKMQLVGLKDKGWLGEPVQRRWILISNLPYKDREYFYAFEVYSFVFLSRPDTLIKWVIVPCFYSPHTGRVNEWFGFYIDGVFEDQLFDPQILKKGYYRRYGEEPFLSSFILLKKFVGYISRQK